MGIVVIVVKARLAQCDSSILMADNRSGMTPVAMCYGPATRWFPTGSACCHTIAFEFMHVTTHL